MKTKKDYRETVLCFTRISISQFGRVRTAYLFGLNLSDKFEKALRRSLCRLKFAFKMASINF
jgi:hypothetical protein